ncbi:MAG: cytidine deaminase [Bacillota bacterium]|nr:cytidine deaminase [Bacillota bacterium]
MTAKSLLTIARAARLKAYAPYSQFAVGAALLTEEGAVVTGANIENASYGLTVCAERVAVWNALHAGYRKFKSIAVIADSKPPPSPCGACRQVLWELAGNIDVYMGNLEDNSIVMSLSELLPVPFGSEKWIENPVNYLDPGEEETWRLPILFHPVGYVVNEYSEPSAIPKNYREKLSSIVIDREMKEGLYRLDEEEQLIIIAYLHRVGDYILKDKRSGRGNETYGVFACRTPSRPNALAQSTVELITVRENVITVKGLDLINGTPVLDIKTVLPGN